MHKPKFTIIAGINGAGKSTSYKYMTDNEKSLLGTRIDPDELTLKYGSEISGGKEAIKLRKQLIDNQTTFHQETTLTGQSILKTIDETIKQGYDIELIYIGLDSAEIAIKRVANRVKNGGHNIPPDTILKRYPESLKNLEEQIYKFKTVKLIDNTDEFETIFEATQEGIILIVDDLPKWSKKPITNYSNEIQNFAFQHTEENHDYDIPNYTTRFNTPDSDSIEKEIDNTLNELNSNSQFTK
jgi:predicted ABC-type ATPase